VDIKCDEVTTHPASLTVYTPMVMVLILSVASVHQA